MKKIYVIHYSLIILRNNNRNENDPQEELQCEEVDMNDPTMDPLEWGVRKMISIPKQYYWVSKNYDVSVRTKVWHRSIATLGVSLRMAEKVGEVLANFTGLNSSRFEDVTVFMSDEEWENARKIADEARVKREQRKEAKKNDHHPLQVV